MGRSRWDNLLSVCFTCLLLFLNSCNQPNLKSESEERLQATPSKTTAVEVKPSKGSPFSMKLSEKDGKHRLLLKSGDISMNSYEGKLIWWLKNNYDKWLLSLIPYPVKSVETVTDTNERKTVRLASRPFSSAGGSFVYFAEITELKDFPGLFFKFNLKNVGQKKSTGNMQLLISMKKAKCVTYQGEETVNLPGTSISLKNWVYMPAGDKQGLGLIMNNSLPGTSFTSNLGRKVGRKWVTDPMQSRWLARRSKQVIKPGDSSEMTLAIVMAGSAEKTHELCQRIKSGKLFPELKLEEGDDSIQREKPVVKKEAKPIFDSKFYSAGKMSAEEVDKWVKKEVKPEQFDIWYGKKDRIDLNGSWKLLKLAGTKKNPECDYGIKHGYEKADFDDSKWFNQPVPFFWNVNFKDRDGVVPPIPKSGPNFKHIIFGGVGWYRKNFMVPESSKGKRIVLCFPGIEQEATIYVNGKKMAFNKSLTIDDMGSIFHMQYNYFEVDITDAVKFGEENSLAVRCYDNGDYYVYRNRWVPWRRKVYAGIGGIWQEVYAEVRPEIYLKKAILSYQVKDSMTTVKAYVVNTGEKTVKEKLSLDFAPWKSKRYSFAQGEPFSEKLGEHVLKPGLNELVFKFKAKKARLWSTEEPNLYQMSLLDSKNKIVGGERVGFREFRAGVDSFLLNGEKVTLRGQQSLWGVNGGSPGRTAMMLQIAYMNRRDVIGKWFEKYKAMNHNIVRNHTTLYPHSFYDIADEVGIMVYGENYFKPYEPFFDKNGVITDIYRKKIKGLAENAMGHPAIVAYSLGNELYDSWLLNKKIDVYSHYLDQIYDEFKKYSTTIPLVSSCGRAPTEKSMDVTGPNPYAFVKKYAKSDFNAVHNYTITWLGSEFAEDDEWPGAFKKYKAAYDMDDKPKVMWNTESVISCIIKPFEGRSKDLDRKYREHVKDGEIDRKWFAENNKFIDSTLYYGTRALNKSVPKFGFLGTTLRDRAMKSQAGFMKHMTEIHRRKRKYVAGVIGNAPMIFTSGVEWPNMDIKYMVNVSEAVKKANQPVLACLDAKWNRNIFSGPNPATPLYLMNDHESDIANAVVIVALRPLDAPGADVSLKDIEFGKMAPGEMKVVDYQFSPSENIKSGHYSAVLTVKYSYKGKKLISTNDYTSYILNRKDIKLDISPKNRIALIQGSETGTRQTVAALEKLKIPFESLKKVENLKNFKIAILPYGGSKYPSGIAEWVAKGGKLLSFAQMKLPEGFPQKTRRNRRYGFFTELIFKSHPILKGLKQVDFRYWNGKRDNIMNKSVADFILTPLCEGVIASQMTIGDRIGMTICEYRLDDGVCLLSQVDAVKRFESDSVATKYIINTLNYCLGDWSAPSAPTLSTGKTSGPAYTINPKDAFSLDIKNACTMGFADEKAGDHKGGWTDQGPEIDLRKFPTGPQTFNGVPFSIIDPKSNNGKSCIVLRGRKETKTEFLPLEKRIIVNRKAKKLYFLVSSAWMSKKFDNLKIGCIKISEEADGSEMAAMFKIDLVNGKTIADWWNAPAHVPSETELGWVGFCGDDMHGHEVGSYIIEWINPYPTKIIDYIDFESDAMVVPAILAITGIKSDK